VPEPPIAVGGFPRAGPEEADSRAGRGPADPAEFDEFFRSNHRHLLGWIRLAGLADQAMAEEIVQDTMLVVFRRWQEIDQPRAYAFMVAKHLALRAARREMARPRVEKSLAPDVTSSIGVPDSAGIRYDIDRAIQSLPRRQRQVAVLHWLIGWSTTEIAAALEVSPSSVASHLHAARTRLRAALDVNPEPA
jgi:RNA polymerase sigma-70 factor (ECF subfamily)